MDLVSGNLLGVLGSHMGSSFFNRGDRGQVASVKCKAYKSDSIPNKRYYSWNLILFPFYCLFCSSLVILISFGSIVSITLRCKRYLHSENKVRCDC